MRQKKNNTHVHTNTLIFNAFDKFRIMFQPIFKKTKHTNTRKQVCKEEEKKAIYTHSNFMQNIFYLKFGC